MEIFEYIRVWITEHPTTTSLIKYIVWVLVILLGISFARKLFKRSLPDISARYRSQKGAEVFGYILIILLTISYFSGDIKDFTLAVGLLTAGIAITLQELILSIAGSFYIFFVKVYKPGDRIEINGIKGDVIDVDSIYTTMMEIGEWVSSDNYSGRIVKLSNSYVFKEAIYNYSQDFPFVWDEFNLPVSYGSNIDLAKKLVIDIASEVLSEYVSQSLNNWKKVVKKYYIEDAQVNPTLAISLNDNWIQFNIRYIVDYKKRRLTKHLLSEKIGKAIQATDGQVTLASATLEIVKIPTFNIKKEESQKSDK
jgi:small-conductance mechanosensitive channel